MAHSDVNIDRAINLIKLGHTPTEISRITDYIHLTIT